MPKPKYKWRKDTVGSIVKHGEVLTMTLLKQELDVGQEFNWRCSCGEEGSAWLSVPPPGHPRALVALSWTAHVSKEHPEVEQ